MGLFESIVQSLIRLFCGPPQEQPPPPRPDHYTIHEPTEEQRISRPQKVQYRPPHVTHPSERVDLTQDEHYRSLRDRAKEEGAAMAKSFDEAHEAYEQGNGALAKELSNKGKQHQAEMERLNREASEWIFSEFNQGREPQEVDLHGLYVKEAIAFTERSIQKAQARGDSEIHLIVGKGLHSHNGEAKIKPAIEELMRKYNLVAELDPSNSGVLVVALDGHGHGGRVVQPGDIARGIERQEEGCLIM